MTFDDHHPQGGQSSPDPSVVSRTRAGVTAVPAWDRTAGPTERQRTWDQLGQLSRHGWTVAAYGPRAQPDRLVAYQKRGEYVDVLVIADEHRCAAYRAPMRSGHDPLSVAEVTWCYLGALAAVLDNLLRLPAPDPSWPSYPIPAEVPLPDTATRPVHVRPPQVRAQAIARELPAARGGRWPPT